MGIFDKLKSKASKHGDKAADVIDKGADFAKEKTGGKYDEQIDTGAEKVKDQFDKPEQGDSSS